MLDHELFLTFACSLDLNNPHLYISPPPIAPGTVVNLDEYCEDKFNIDEKTGELLQFQGRQKIPNMGEDGVFITPNGIRFKIVFIKRTYQNKHIQYIQPDGKYAHAGESIKLPNGEVYKGKNNEILYQQDVPEQTEFLSEDEYMEPAKFISIEDLNFDFGYK